jgi:hypothetical protein
LPFYFCLFSSFSESSGVPPPAGQVHLTIAQTEWLISSQAIKFSSSPEAEEAEKLPTMKKSVLLLV